MVRPAGATPSGIGLEKPTRIPPAGLPAALEAAAVTAEGGGFRRRPGDRSLATSYCRATDAPNARSAAATACGTGTATAAAARDGTRGTTAVARRGPGTPTAAAPAAARPRSRSARDWCVIRDYSKRPLQDARFRKVGPSSG
jgi:hypothetical protein